MAFSFNKKGDTIRLAIGVENEPFTVTVQNIESFDGTQLEPVEVTSLSETSEIMEENNE